MGLHVNRNLALEAPSAIALRMQPQADADPRAALAAQFIAAGARVLELGRGGALQALLPNGCHYSICDLSADFPTKAAAEADIIVMLGALETVADAETLFTHLRFCKRDVLLSYHPTNLGLGRGFANHFSFYDLTLLFDRYTFRIECTTPIDDAQVLMRLTPSERLRPVATCNVAVISDNDAGNLGGRLGYHMINALLPGEAEVHHLTFSTLAQARGHYDLVVLGIGNSLFRPLLGDDVLDIVSRAKASIGIFGTQYRELIPRAALERLIDRLDTWFARYEDDVLLYGRGRKNVVHLGDWLIDQFPLNRPSLDDPLQIDDEIGGRTRARPYHPGDPAAPAGLFVAACAAAVRAHLRRTCRLCRAAGGGNAGRRIRQVPQHADRCFRAFLRREEVLHGRPRRGHPLQGAGPP